MGHIEIDGLTVRHAITGEGPPAIVLHGWGSNIETVASIVAVLAPIMEVHALDLPGFGESDPPPRAWGPQDYAVMLTRFMDAVGIGKAAFIGHSNGGRVAIATAVANADRVSKMVLIDSAGIRPRRGLNYHRKVAMAKAGKHAARRLGPLGAKLRELLASKSASADYAATSPEMRPTFVALVNSDLTEMLPRIAVPTLLIWGSEDTATPLRDGKLMERLIPDAGLVVFEGAGHFSYLDEPARFAAVMRHFFGGAG